MNKQHSFNGAGNNAFQLHEWVVNPAQGVIFRNGTPQDGLRIKPRTMEVLCYLADHAEDVVSVAELLDQIWGKTGYAGPNAVRKCVTELRAAFNESASQSRLIETIPKKGYRLLAKPIPVLTHATVEPTSAQANEEQQGSPDTNILKRWILIPLLPLLLGGGFLAWYFPGELDMDACLEDRDSCIQETTLTIPPFNVDLNDPELAEMAFALRQGMLAELQAYEWITSVDDSNNETAESDHIFKAHLRQVGDGHSLTATLVRREDGHILYQRVFDTKTMYASNPIERLPSYLAGAVSVGLDPVERELMKMNGFTDATARWLWHQSRNISDSPQRVFKAIELNREMLSFDPNVSEAYVMLAWALQTLARIDEENRFSEVREQLVDVLLKVKNSKVTEESKRIVALSIANTNGDLKEVERILRDRIEQGREPESGDLERRHYGYYYQEYANLLSRSGLVEEAHAFQTAGVLKCRSEGRCQSHPLPVPAFDLQLLQHDDWTALTERLRENLSEYPDSISNLTTAIGIFGKLGEYDIARRYLSRLQQVDAGKRWYLHSQAELNRYINQSDLKGDVMAFYLANPKASSLSKVLILLALGDIEQAQTFSKNFTIQERILFHESRLWQEYAHFPDWVREHPDYLKLLGSLSLGLTWQDYLQERVNAMSPVTGVLPGGILDAEHTALLEEFSSSS